MLPPLTANLVCWADANTLLGSLSPGDAVTAIADESGNGADFSLTGGYLVSAPGRRAAVRGAIQCNPIATVSLTGATGFTFIAAYNTFGSNKAFAPLLSTAPSGQNDYNSSNGALVCFNSSSPTTFQAFYAGSSIFTSGTAIKLDGTPKLFCLRVNSSTVKLSVNGSVVGSATGTFGTIAPTLFSIGQRLGNTGETLINDLVFAGMYGVGLSDSDDSALWSWASPLLTPSSGGSGSGVPLSRLVNGS